MQPFRLRYFVLLAFLGASFFAAAQPTGPVPLDEADETAQETVDDFWKVYVRLLSSPNAATEVERMLGAGVDINEQNSAGRSLLGEAAVRNNAQVVKMLLDYGADPNHSDTVSGFSPLHEAALRGYTVVGRLLIEAEADINAIDSAQATPLHLACGNGHFDFAKLLLQARATVEAKDGHAITPLHSATLYGDPRIVALLIAAEADVMARTKESWDLPGGMTPLHIAAADGNLTICRLLFEAGAFINAVDNDGKTPLNHAYIHEQHGVINYLTDKGGVY